MYLNADLNLDKNLEGKKKKQKHDGLKTTTTTERIFIWKFLVLFWGLFGLFAEFKAPELNGYRSVILRTINHILH